MNDFGLNKNNSAQFDSIQFDDPQADSVHNSSPGGSAEPSLNDARKAWVGSRYRVFADSFRFYDEYGYQVSFTHIAWAPFFLTWIWFLYRKMYLETVIIFVIQMFLGALSLSFGDNISVGLNFLFSLFLALSGRWLYWKATDRQIEKALAQTHGHRHQAVAFLAGRGGVNTWVLWVWATLTAFAIFSLYAANV